MDEVEQEYLQAYLSSARDELEPPLARLSAALRAIELLERDRCDYDCDGCHQGDEE